MCSDTFLVQVKSALLVWPGYPDAFVVVAYGEAQGGKHELAAPTLARR
ncbi:hypothetical protein KFU94_55150 [Chloroflexi bacterium TSY]|nr:hypothetical protein [Chloroflexi bacterium TSY]